MTINAFVVFKFWTDLHARQHCCLYALTCLNPLSSATHHLLLFGRHAVTVQITVGHMPSSSTMTVAQHHTSGHRAQLY